MKILVIHNAYGIYGGEEAVVDFQTEAFRKAGHEVILYRKESSELYANGFRGKIEAFFSSFYNRKAIRELERVIADRSPDVAIVHNLFPVISPAVLPHIKKAGVPIVMILHNYRMACPNARFFTKGKICEKCLGGMKELNCVINDCENSFFKSVCYALRNFWARSRGYFDAVDVFVALTDFQKRKLSAAGLDENKIKIIPNSIDITTQPIAGEAQCREYVGYVGRISQEKGIGVLIEAARRLPEVPFRVAGKISDGTVLADLPPNVTLCGPLGREQLPEFYSNARIMVMTSVWYECFPMVLLEAMLYRTPVIAPRLGGIPEIIEDGYNGLLFRAGDGVDLARRTGSLWNDRAQGEIYAANGYEKVLKYYSSDIYLEDMLHQFASLK